MLFTDSSPSRYGIRYACLDVEVQFSKHLQNL